MKLIGIKVIVVALALAMGLVALARTADATHVKAEITVPDQATVGQPTEVRATLRSAHEGQPIAGASVTFFADASFGGVDGEVELGQAVTDEDGVATLTYEPRLASEHELRVEYLAPGDSEPEVISKSISVADGGLQLHRSTAGVEIPGLNVWVLIALVSAVWAILLSVAFRVIAIAQAGSEAEMVAEKGARLGHAERQPTSGAR